MLKEVLSPTKIKDRMKILPQALKAGLFPYPTETIVDSSGKIIAGPNFFHENAHHRQLMYDSFVGGPRSHAGIPFEVISAGLFGLSNVNKIIISYLGEPDFVTKMYLSCAFPFTKAGRQKAERAAEIMKDAHAIYQEVGGDYVLPSTYYVDESVSRNGRKIYRVFEKQTRALIPISPYVFEMNSFDLLVAEALMARTFLQPQLDARLAQAGLLLSDRTASCEVECFDLIRGHLLMLDLFDYADPETGTVRRIGANA
jgi:hypothetical protein